MAPITSSNGQDAWSTEQGEAQEASSTEVIGTSPAGPVASAGPAENKLFAIAGHPGSHEHGQYTRSAESEDAQEASSSDDEMPPLIEGSTGGPVAGASPAENKLVTVAGLPGSREHSDDGDGDFEEYIWVEPPPELDHPFAGIGIDKFSLPAALLEKFSMYLKKKSMRMVVPCKHIAASVRPLARVSGSRMRQRIPAEHHAILDTVLRRVVHYNRYKKDEVPIVMEESLDDFMKMYGQWRVVQVPKSKEQALEVLERARSKIGASGYSIVFNNCETFAHWCFGGAGHSQQVSLAAAGVGTGVVAGVSTGVVAGVAVSAATTTVVTTSTSNAYALGFIPWGSSTIAETVQFATYSSPAAVAVGTAAAVGTVTVSLGAFYGLRKWIQYSKSKVIGRVPICIYNDSGAPIRVRLTSESVFDFVYDAWSYFGVGSMAADIPSLMEGELAPPVAEESVDKFTLQVFVKDEFANVVFKCEVHRGDVLVYTEADPAASRPRMLTRIGSD